jgi:hypothetical protein
MDPSGSIRNSGSICLGARTIATALFRAGRLDTQKSSERCTKQAVPGASL